jgi:hypothetical protein
VKCLVEQGLLSKAMWALEAGPVVVALLAMLECLVVLHLPNPTPKTDWLALLAMAPGFCINANAIVKVVCVLLHGTASGPSTWTFELVVVAYTSEVVGPVALLLTKLVCCAAKGWLCWWGLLMASHLVALTKPNGGVCPITMGEALYCLISHILLSCNPTMASLRV